jgi:hypothetical protein
VGNHEGIAGEHKFGRSVVQARKWGREYRFQAEDGANGDGKEDNVQDGEDGTNGQSEKLEKERDLSRHKYINRGECTSNTGHVNRDQMNG